MEDMTTSPEQSGNSEQPDSLDKILRQDAVSSFSSVFHGAIGEAIRMVGLNRQLDGDLEEGVRLEEAGDRIVLQANLSRMGVSMSDLRRMIPREKDLDTVDGEIIEPRKEIE